MAKFLGLRKSSWRKVLTVGLSVLLICGAVAGCVALFGKDTKTIGAGEFTRGKINPFDGKYVESTTSIYTKDAFPCQGLRVVPDFESSGEFEVFFYDAHGNLMESSGAQRDTYEADMPEASCARVVYTPDKPADVKAADWSIGILEVSKYARQLTITVDKDQTEYKTSNDLYRATTTTGGFAVENINTLNTSATVQSSEVVNLDGTYDLYRIYVRYDEIAGQDVKIAFAKEDGKAIYVNEDGKVESGFAATMHVKDMQEGSWYSVIVEVPEDATSLRIQGPVGENYRIYGIEVK